MSAPEIGAVVLAETDTRTAQRVAVEVTAIDAETDAGWSVWGYRQYRPGRRPRQTMYPRRYFVPRRSA